MKWAITLLGLLTLPLLFNAVNLAARLESSTKEVGEDIVIGYETIKNCTIPYRELDSIFVKGKEKPIKIYTL